MKKGVMIGIVIIILLAVGGLFFMSENIKDSIDEIQCDTSKKPFEFNADHKFIGPPPDLYLVKVYVETTSLWTNVNVEGLQSTKISEHILLNDIDPRTNVDVRGIEVKDISRPRTDLEVLPAIILEFESIIQKDGDTAIFRINKGKYGYTTYKLYSVNGNSTEEIARFFHNGTEDDILRTFTLDLDLLSTPLDFPGIKENYDGPLFDAHLHLLGSGSENNNRAQDDRLYINPKNAEEIFAMMDKQGVIGLFGFLPVIHEYFVGDPSFNDETHEDALSVLNRCDNIIFPFLYPYSHIGITPEKYGSKLSKLIEKTHKENQIQFIGVGELHTEYPQTDTYDEMRLIDPGMLELYDYAAENSLIVMIHPLGSNLEDIRGALKHNKKTIFLLHGGEGVEDFLPTLFQEYDNLYYSLDAILLGDYTLANDGMTKEEFINNLQSNKMYYKILATALHNWKPLIEEFPDRMMWGTDALWTWHFEEEVYSEITWFAREFIGRLDQDVQENFAYKNAERLIS